MTLHDTRRESVIASQILSHAPLRVAIGSQLRHSTRRQSLCIVNLPTLCTNILSNASRMRLSRQPGLVQRTWRIVEASYAAHRETLPDEINARRQLRSRPSHSTRIILRTIPYAESGDGDGCLQAGGLQGQTGPQVQVTFLSTRCGICGSITSDSCFKLLLLSTECKNGDLRTKMPCYLKRAGRSVAGVEYILCNRISRTLRLREYCLDLLYRGRALETLIMQYAIIDNNIVVQFDL
ncbi:hypothetical protein PsorP6_006144 [Peronosclerospora sorghi]|uniref:Uncharacterized protein n=1 Tax=Peronosclerospora sorghi TaxID=230839 RepID=A0ACC0W1L4_9STRA|nr:hypothetical protein PsorP6_006144 [Peronosclerospora sorghi]